MKSPCIGCSKWATKKFPDCRTKCEKIDDFLTEAKQGLQPALGEYVHIPYGITSLPKIS